MKRYPSSIPSWGLNPCPLEPPPPPITTRPEFPPKIL